MAVDAVTATHGADGGVATAVPVPASATLVPTSAIVCVAVSACASTLLAYYATLAVSLACFARAVWPDRVDAVHAYARRKALLAREDLEADLRRLRDAARSHPAAAGVYDGAEECARRARAAVAGFAERARRRAEAKWGAAWVVLCLLGRVIRLAATVLLGAACEEARAQAPAVLGYLRGVVHAIRSPASCKRGEEGKEEEEAAAGLELKDVVFLVAIGFYLLFSMELILRFNTSSELQFCTACLVAMCGLATLIDDWIDPPDDADDKADTTSDAADTAQLEGVDAAKELELEVRESWQFMCVLIVIAFCVEAFLLDVMLGPQPIALALLALCNFKVLDVGQQVQLTPDDGEGTKGSAEGVDAAVDKWRRGAMAVFAASSVKVFVIYLVLDFYLAALSFLWLCVMADLLLAEEDSFFEWDVSGDDEDRKEGAGLGEDVTGGGDEGADEARAEDSNTSSSEDEEEGSSGEHDEDGGNALEEHCDSSEEHEHLNEQRQEEPGYGSGGSMDDGWDLVEVDPEMPIKDNCGAHRKSSRLFPWK
ncbi:hypothetical protein BAE44_0004319 [Dichanthelium oligosanthes]|uniref:Uncharacterized protein n=1 Tax=Dichanthelium oligosanthes TaxID=888268 RepID=A0A1E5WBA5_9POAL|nr:hypothetical protein BAE44_0004319 [Dichanthelium oligosanthes]